jgi:type IV secretory pathway VirB2 component (pilin)
VPRLRLLPLFLGTLLIVLGSLWLLGNLDLIEWDFGQLLATYWPVILIVIGLDFLAGRAGTRWSGGLLVGVGAVYLAANLGLVTIDPDVLWTLVAALVIILLGASILRSALSPGGTQWAIMSGIEQAQEGEVPERGGFIALMGGVELDLSRADFPHQETVLNLTAMMGGVEVKVPADVTVECQATAILGGVECLGQTVGGVLGSRTITRPATVSSPKRLLIRATALMGGVEIESA